MEPTTIAIDLAKRVFQIHYVEFFAISSRGYGRLMT